MPRSAIIWTRSRKLEFKCDVPSHTQNDDLLVKMPPLEQILCRGRFRHPGTYRTIPSLSTSLHQNLPELVKNFKRDVLGQPF
jgi:hypothetical protein